MDEDRTSNVTLRQLEIFAAVISSGSVSGATRRTGLSQPTISHHINKLEQTLGTRLLGRSRSGEVELTTAGEYWYRCSAELLGTFDKMYLHHVDRFAQNRLVLQFGTTPSLRGRFLGAAARFALQEPQIARFQFVWGTTSADIVEQIRLHQLNCAVVSEASVRGDQGSLSVTPLFVDRIVWAVPRSIPDEVIHETLLARLRPSTRFDALTRYVDVGKGVPWRAESEEWYRTNLPFALPYFSSPTHQSAVDLVAEGLATCHFPLALLPNLPAQVVDGLHLFELDNFERAVVLIMPRHLLSVAAFANFRERLTAFAIKSYQEEMQPQRVAEMPEEVRNGAARPGPATLTEP